MKHILTAHLALVATATFAVTFAPKEYVDRMDETNRVVMAEYVDAAIAPLCSKAALARYMPLEGTNTAHFTVGTIRSTFGHIDELEIGALLTLGSWNWLNVNGVTITAYGDSRYIRQTSITNVVKNVVNSLDIKGGGISQEELLPFGSNIAHSVMMSVVTNNLPNLTWDSKLNLAWKKSAEGGCFYETAYSNVNVIVTGELRR